LKHKINLAKYPLYKKQFYWEKSNNFAKGGNLIGNQSRLDRNKNGRIDSEDLRMIRENKMAKGGNINSEIDELYVKSGFINDDFNWKLKLIEMLEDSSIEAYQIYQKLNSKQKEEVLQELFSMNNDMGADGDGEIETSRENLEILLEDAKNGKKYAKGGRLKAKKKKDYSQNRNPELDKMYMAEKKGKRVSQKVAQIERRDGTIFKRRNANQYGKVKGGNTYYEYSDNRTDSRKYLAKGGNLGLHYVIFDGTSAFVCDEQDMLNITTKDKDCEVVFKSVNLEKASDFADNYNGKTSLEKGGQVNYKKNWEVFGILMNGKKFKKTIILGRMSDKDDVKNQIKRMQNDDFRVMEVTSIKEVSK
jgi:hypothetical protein